MSDEMTVGDWREDDRGWWASYASGRRAARVLYQPFGGGWTVEVWDDDDTADGSPAVRLLETWRSDPDNAKRAAMSYLHDIGYAVPLDTPATEAPTAASTTPAPEAGAAGSGVGTTLFACRLCGRACWGWTDAAMAEPGWHDIARIDGPSAACPRCVADAPGSLDGWRDEYPSVAIGAARPLRRPHPSGAPDAAETPEDRPRDVAAAFARLRELAGGAFDHLDVAAMMRDLRGDDGPAETPEARGARLRGLAEARGWRDGAWAFSDGTMSVAYLARVDADGVERYAAALPRGATLDDALAVALGEPGVPGEAAALRAEVARLTAALADAESERDTRGALLDRMSWAVAGDPPGSPGHMMWSEAVAAVERRDEADDANLARVTRERDDARTALAEVLRALGVRRG